MLASNGTLPPLFCVPLLVKDNMETQGMAACNGAVSLLDNVAPQDAHVVRHELALQGSSSACARQWPYRLVQLREVLQRVLLMWQLLALGRQHKGTPLHPCMAREWFRSTSTCCWSSCLCGMPALLPSECLSGDVCWGDGVQRRLGRCLGRCLATGEPSQSRPPAMALHWCMLAGGQPHLLLGQTLCDAGCRSSCCARQARWCWPSPTWRSGPSRPTAPSAAPLGWCATPTSWTT